MEINSSHQESNQQKKPYTPDVWTDQHDSFYSYLIDGSRVDTKCRVCLSLSSCNLYFLHPNDNVFYLIVTHCAFKHESKHNIKSCKGTYLPIDCNIPYVKLEFARNIFNNNIYPKFEKIWKMNEQNRITKNNIIRNQEVGTTQNNSIIAHNIYNPSNPPKSSNPSNSPPIIHSPKCCKCFF